MLDILDNPIESRRRRWALLLTPVALAAVWLASGYGVPEALTPRTRQLQGLVTTFLGIFIEALPFILAGVAASVAIQRWVSPELLARMSGRSAVGGALRGALLGMAFPVCECGAIPASRRLLRKGAPPPLGIAFALAAPVVNPIVLVSTLVAFGDWRWAAGRIGFTILIAMAVGLLVGAGTRREAVLALGDDDDEMHIHHAAGSLHEHHDEPEDRSWRGLISHGIVELIEMSQYLILGALLAATMQTFIPQSALVGLSGEGSLGILGPLVAVLIMMAIAVLLSVCSTVDAFLGLAFLGLFHPGAVMAFLVFGPMIDIKSTLMLTSTFRRQAVAAMVLISAQLALVAGLATYVVLG